MIKKASAMILACILVVVLVILGAALLSRTISENNSSRHYLMNAQSFWLAEAAVSAAKSQLKDDWLDHASGGGQLDTHLNLSFESGTYSFDIYGEDDVLNPDWGIELQEDELLIVARGRVEVFADSGDFIERVLLVVAGVDVPAIYKYAIVGVTKVELKSGTTVHGDIYVKGDLEVKDGASVVKHDDLGNANAYDANAYYTGDIANIDGTVEGDVIQTEEDYPIPTFDWAEIKSEADYLHAGNTILSGTLTDGVYYIEGDVQLDDVFINQGAIIATGKVEINGSFENNEPFYGIPVLAAQDGTMEVQGEVNVRGLIYCQVEGIELKTEGTIMNVYGSVIGASSDVEIKASEGALHLYYKQQYLMGFPGQEIELKLWREELNTYPLI